MKMRSILNYNLVEWRAYLTTRYGKCSCLLPEEIKYFECNFSVIGHLGSGQFGNVEKGMWQSKEVALKNLKEGSGKQDKVKFLQEAAIMAQFTHPNIVILHGVVSDKEPVSSTISS